MQWESQHDNLSCEKYQEWRENNDLENQKNLLEKFLDSNGMSM